MMDNVRQTRRLILTHLIACLTLISAHADNEGNIDDPMLDQLLNAINDAIEATYTSRHSA